MNYWALLVTFPPTLVTGVIYIAAAYYFLRDLKASRIKVLIYGALIFLFLYAGLLSVLQYQAWSNNEFTKVFLNFSLGGETDLPVVLKGFDSIFESKLGYFLFYSWGRFWINPLIVVLCAFAFYLFLKALKKYNERFFRDGEVEIGLLAALLSGWPEFVVFLPLAFLTTVLVSIFRLVFLKEEYTTLGLPILLAGLTTSIFGQFLVNLLSLTTLNI